MANTAKEVLSIIYSGFFPIRSISLMVKFLFNP